MGLPPARTLPAFLFAGGAAVGAGEESLVTSAPELEAVEDEEDDVGLGFEAAVVGAAGDEEDDDDDDETAGGPLDQAEGFGCCDEG